MAQRKCGSWWLVGVVAGLLFLFALQAVLSLRTKFTTFDEGYYLSGGYSYLVTGDTRVVNRFHPPLAQVLSALPLLGLDLNPPQRDPAWWLPKSDLSSRTFALNFLYHNQVPWQSILIRGRLMMVALGVVVGLLVFLWATELWGVRSGLLALVLYAFSPNLLAHARLTTTDFAVAGLAFAACYVLWRFYRRPGLLRLVLAGLVLGLALSTKLSALVFCPIVVLLSVLYVVSPPGERRRREPRGDEAEEKAPPPRRRRLATASAAVLVVAALACGVIWLGYLGATGPGTREQFIEQACSSIAGEAGGGEVRRVLADLCSRVSPLIPWPKQYWELFAWLLAKSRSGHRAFLAGRLSQSGWWYYFPVVLALKTPLPTLILAALALVVGWSRRNLFDRLFLLIPPTVFLLVSMTSHINIGYRHVLPVLPFLLVYASQLVASSAPARRDLSEDPPERRKRTRRSPYGGWSSRMRVFGLGALLVWYVVGTVRVAPHYLAYFNELAGGPRQGYRYLVDSNLDWGQDLLGLRDYLREHDIENVKLAYFGSATRDIIRSLGIPYRPITREERRRPAPGVYAVSATRLQGAYGTGAFGSARGAEFAWLKRLEPEAVIGYTIFVYRVTEADVARLKEQRQ